MEDCDDRGGARNALAYRRRAITLQQSAADGGYRSAANALKAVIEQQRRPWQSRLVNLTEGLDPADMFRKVTGLRLQDGWQFPRLPFATVGSLRPVSSRIDNPESTIDIKQGEELNYIAQLWRRGSVRHSPTCACRLSPASANSTPESFAGERDIHSHCQDGDRNECSDISVDCRLELRSRGPDPGYSACLQFGAGKRASAAASAKRNELDRRQVRVYRRMGAL